MVIVVWNDAPGLHHELAVAARLVQLDALADDILSHPQPQTNCLVATPSPQLPQHSRATGRHLVTPAVTGQARPGQAPRNLCGNGSGKAGAGTL